MLPASTSQPHHRRFYFCHPKCIQSASLSTIGREIITQQNHPSCGRDFYCFLPRRFASTKPLSVRWEHLNKKFYAKINICWRERELTQSAARSGSAKLKNKHKLDGRTAATERVCAPASSSLQHLSISNGILKSALSLEKEKSIRFVLARAGAATMGNA